MISGKDLSKSAHWKKWQRSLDKPEKFWSEIAEKLHWYKKWDKVFDTSDAPFTKWFIGGTTNICYQCLDLAVKKGYGDDTAYIFDSPLTKTKTDWTYKEVLDQVRCVAGLMQRQWGVQKGDRIVIYMPMMVEGAIALLASARIGAIHCPVPSGLPAQALAVRIDVVKPKVILMASHGYTMAGWLDYKKELDDAINRADYKPERVLVYQREGMDKVSLEPCRDYLWKETVEKADPVDCVPMESTEPFFLVFSSGSTRNPKVIVHSVGNLMVRVQSDFTDMYKELGKGSTYATSNWGWALGPAMQVYVPLMARRSSVLFEGDPLIVTDITTIYRILSEHKVLTAWLRPGLLKVIRSKDPDGKLASQYNFDSVASIYVAGERTDETTYYWIIKTFKCSVYNVWGQTEAPCFLTGVPDYTLFGKNNPGIGDCGMPSCGWRPCILRDDMTPAAPNETGNIVMKLPTPPGFLLTLYENKELCRETYFSRFPGYYDTKDHGFKDEYGLVKVVCRSDDVMKTGSIYLTAQEVEEVVLQHPDVADCAVISVLDLEMKEIPLVVYISKESGWNREAEVSQQTLESLGKHFGSTLTFAGAVAVQNLPRTRTGKIQRPSLTALARGEPITALAAVENPEIFPELTKAFKAAGHGVSKYGI